MAQAKPDGKGRFIAVSGGGEGARVYIMDDLLHGKSMLLRPRFEVEWEAYIHRLWEANPRIYEILSTSDDIEEARDRLFTYLERTSRRIFRVDNDLHLLNKAVIREAVRVFKSVIAPENEKRTDTSALRVLWNLANGLPGLPHGKVSAGFMMEFIHLFRAVVGKSNIYGEKPREPEFTRLSGREAAKERTESLDDIAATMRKYFQRYPSGLNEEVVGWREENRARILRHFGGELKDWNDHVWQLRHVIRDPRVLADLVELNPEQEKSVSLAVKNRLPFGITPYYLSLMDRKRRIGFDNAIRAQVIPPPDYVREMIAHKDERSVFFDFMGEHDTSPVDLVTRRYPGIAILKPFHTCAQICVYCQRNWEIGDVMDPAAAAHRRAVDEALEWFDHHRWIREVLVTGGDPLVMKDRQLLHIVERLAEKRHIHRIRIGTRTPVVLPQRLTDEFMDRLAAFHEPGRREIVIVTHFEHSYEITPEAMEAVQKIRRRGMSVYNQQVFTLFNSRRFETAKLRTDLRLIGVDPYYTFNMKGKAEARRYMVPIARLMQERKEEARLLPGLDRTDEPVFNVPRLGKNHLRAQQDHRLVMIRPDGRRVYEFHPWEKNITLVPPYFYTDVSIYDYLEEIASRGENIRDYRTIWYYY